MLKKLVTAALLSLPLLLSTACDDEFTVSSKELKPGGLYVTYVQPQDCSGCDALNRGDLIQEVDGTPVKTTDELLAKNITDGQPHKIKFFDKSADNELKEIEITATPNNSMTPVKDAPPVWTVGADELNEAPSWARRRLFGHASPQLLLVNSDGGFVNGRDLYGKKVLMVFFDWAASSDRQNGALSMQVLQKAQADLKNKGVEIVFAQIAHPQQREIAPMNDTDLRKFFTDNQVGPAEGGPLPPPPMYRMPNKTEDNPTRVLGLEGAFTYYEAIGEAPNIFLLDEHGIIRWHSAGVTPDPEGKIAVDMVYTINAAVLFALNSL
ncbi:PDZ domain-containing protein [Enhygromyxa salina]|uniref:PDZ domain-containing protein n=1 Tax=Enhygromyxa salina TaxID=215803 RepID=A0A2S9YKQ1_9BACT|nr:PDZ domain-containing protein [Enhygromyxa salina]PRQ05673.1 hypothetical protein ENSA7_44060 [Enhygromyxa salina]